MRLASLLLAVLAVVALGGRALAQDATPSTAEGTPSFLPSELPVTPDPSDCTVEAPTIQDLLAAAAVTPVPGTPDFSDEGAMASPAAFTLPEGEPADAGTVDAITATMREVIACINTGNFLYIFAFVTDDLFRVFTAEPISEAEVEFFMATPPALEATGYATLVAVRDVTVLPDGRVGALVETVFPQEEPGVQVDYFIFEEVESRWLIDEIVEDLESQYPPSEMATPAA